MLPKVLSGPLKSDGIVAVLSQTAIAMWAEQTPDAHSLKGHADSLRNVGPLFGQSSNGSPEINRGPSVASSRSFDSDLNVSPFMVVVNRQRSSYRWFSTDVANTTLPIQNSVVRHQRDSVLFLKVLISLLWCHTKSTDSSKNSTRGLKRFGKTSFNRLFRSHSSSFMSTWVPGSPEQTLGPLRRTGLTSYEPPNLVSVSGVLDYRGLLLFLGGSLRLPLPLGQAGRIVPAAQRLGTGSPSCVSETP